MGWDNPPSKFGDELEKKLKRLGDIGDRVSFTEMFNPKFISENSSFGTLEELFDKSGFKIETEEDFKAIPDEEWEAFIVKNTGFDSWENMQKEAWNSFVKEKMEA